MEREFTFEEIEEYLSGTLPEETVLQIEAEIKNNPSFAATVEKHREAHLLVHNYSIGQLKNKVKRIHEEEVKKEAVTSPPWMKIAASLLVFFLAGGYFIIRSEYRSDQLFTESFNTYPNQFSVMGTVEKNLFTEGLDHYDRQEYNDAIVSFSKIPPESEYAIPAQLYSGVSFLALNQPESSIDVLSKLLAMETAYSDAARWYLALAYVKNGDENTAIGLLETIVKTQGYQSKQAEKLLQKLNSPFRKLPGI